jgi:hypothetical protein
VAPTLLELPSEGAAPGQWASSEPRNPYCPPESLRGAMVVAALRRATEATVWVMWRVALRLHAIVTPRWHNAPVCLAPTRHHQARHRRQAARSRRNATRVSVWPLALTIVPAGSKPGPGCGPNFRSCRFSLAGFSPSSLCSDEILRLRRDIVDYCGFLLRPGSRGLAGPEYSFAIHPEPMSSNGHLPQLIGERRLPN